MRRIRLSGTASTVCACSLLFLTACPSQAALPPYAQRIREMQAILDSDAVGEKLRTHGVIDRIEWVSHYRYRLYTAKCEMEVRLRGEYPPEARMKRGWVGAPHMVVDDTGDLTCR